MYLVKFGHTSETWAKMLANPEDRRQVLAPSVESAGGKLHGYWYAFGEYDGYVLFEAPDDIAAAGILVRVGSTGAFAKLETTKLLTVEEALHAFSQAGGVTYHPPGG